MTSNAWENSCVGACNDGYSTPFDNYYDECNDFFEEDDEYYEWCCQYEPPHPEEPDDIPEEFYCSEYDYDYVPEADETEDIDGDDCEEQLNDNQVMAGK
jgi:hypothetical protein